MPLFLNNLRCNVYKVTAKRGLSLGILSTTFVAMNPLCSLLNIPYPIIQAGMIWCSGWKLALASSEAGGLGVIGSGSMYPDVLEEHLSKMVESGCKQYAVNLPLLYPQIDDHIDLISKYGVPVVITSAGSPKKYTQHFQSKGIKVGHVVSSSLFAQKSADAGVDFVIAEGFEAGGHNGHDETTTLCLIPAVREEIGIPLVAAGGIASGRAMLAAMDLGADGVQIGSRFVASEESSAHISFKQAVVNAGEGDTQLTLKELTPVRLLDNPFYQSVQAAYANDMGASGLKELLGRGRAKKGMFEGDMDEGELEIGQISSMIKQILPVKAIFQQILDEFEETMNERDSHERFIFGT